MKGTRERGREGGRKGGREGGREGGRDDFSDIYTIRLKCAFLSDMYNLIKA